MVIGAGKLIDGVYCFQQSHSGHSIQAFHATTISLHLLYQHLCHLSYSTMQYIPEISCLSSSFPSSCSISVRAKQTRTSFSNSISIAKDLLDLIHCGLWRLYKYPSPYGSFYFLTIIDDFSHDVWVYLFSQKKKKMKYLNSLNIFMLLHKTNLENP